MVGSYINLLKSGELKKRVDAARQMLAECTLCPRACKVNRLNGELGICKGGAEAVISSAGPHYGEEPPISGPPKAGGFYFISP